MPRLYLGHNGDVAPCCVLFYQPSQQAEWLEIQAEWSKSTYSTACNAVQQ